MKTTPQDSKPQSTNQAVRVADCPKFAVGLLQRGWLECDGRTVQLSPETKLLLAENVE
jgi:hypothetical protein